MYTNIGDNGLPPNPYVYSFRVWGPWHQFMQGGSWSSFSAIILLAIISVFLL